MPNSDDETEMLMAMGRGAKEPTNPVIERAYREGFCDGLQSCAGVAASIEIEEAWCNSDARVKARLARSGASLGGDERVANLIHWAKVLHQNSVGCATEHHGADFAEFGMPGWLTDAQTAIDEALKAIGGGSGGQ